MNIVLDTNVLISGLLSPHHAPGEIVRMIASNYLQLCYDSRILSEYNQVLIRPKFNFDTSNVNIIMEHIKKHGLLVASQPLKHRLPHQDDEPFLEAAIAGNVSFLVTGNVKHFPKKVYNGVKIVKPVDFLNQYRGLIKE